MLKDIRNIIKERWEIAHRVYFTLEHEGRYIHVSYDHYFFRGLTNFLVYENDPNREEQIQDFAVKDPYPKGGEVIKISFQDACIAIRSRGSRIRAHRGPLHRNSREPCRK